MQRISGFFKCMLIVSVLTLTNTNPCAGDFRVVKKGSDTAGIGFSNQILPAQPAPTFSLKDMSGTNYELSKLTAHPMIILYFFDAESRPSQEGFLGLDNLARQYKGMDLTVWGITTSAREATGQFVVHNHPTLPVLLDPGHVSDLYQARMILPTICIIGPDLKAIDYFQGGGKTTEIMLVRLAERTLQRKKTLLAKAISDRIIEKNPDNVKVKALKGYAEIKEGNLLGAEEIFRKVSRETGDGEILGKEGLSVVYAKRGETEKALKTAAEVTEKAPERSYAHLIKADILYNQNKKDEAEVEYRKAVENDEAEPYQKATALNQFGRFYANLGKFDQARQLYEHAVMVDPYYIEATSNKGMTFEKEGNWEKALGAYQEALNLDSSDTFASVLARKAQQMIDLQNNTEKRRQVDQLVKELSERFRKQQAMPTSQKDTWTSRPMVISFVDFQEKGRLSERDGFSMVLTTQLGEQLNASGRLKVVERVVLDQLLAGLNLGSS
ncbi:MAG: tetratricopeptide repeat protein, partial [Deltaproteobacteria bacterium]|nr:tetratricopeptide repeat protein [Deltaproteobacteria bacterium]